MILSRYWLPLFALGAVALSTGCSDAPGTPDGAQLGGPEYVSEAEDPIINGTKDTTHQAVVFVAGVSNSGCSGTIVSVQGSVAYVLSAAHCKDPQFVLQGNDYNNPTAYYPVTKFQRHPSWSGLPPNYDFMVIQVSGASPSTPTIPLMTPAEDNLTNGTQVRHVGYGKVGSAPGTPTTERHELVGTLSAVAPISVTYNQPNGGPCQGDSGGPQLSIGVERVAAVTSSGDKNCMSSGFSGRVSAAYNTFINPYITNTPPGPQTCDQCTQGATTGTGAACFGIVKACLDDTHCGLLVSCFEMCAPNDQACVNQCAKDHSLGVSKYLAIFDCVCDTACKAECDGEPICSQGGPSSTVVASASSTGASADAGATTGAGGDPTGGAMASAGGGAAPPTDDGNWVAGNQNDKKYEGQIVSSCTLSQPSRDSRGLALWALLLLGCVRRGRARRRKLQADTIGGELT